MEDMDYYEWEESRKRFTPKKIIKFIFKTIVLIIIGGTFALLFGRIFLMGIPKAFKGLTWTDAAVEAYANGSFAVELQDVYEPFSNKGEYHISNTALVRLEYTRPIFPDTDSFTAYADYARKLAEPVSKGSGEVQFTVRYNNRSTINRLMRLYSLTERPEGEVFVYILSDSNGKVYTDYSFAEGDKPMYDFRRVIFHDVDFTDVKAFYLEVFYIDDVRRPKTAEPGTQKEETMYASFVIYDVSYSEGESEVTKPVATKLIFSERPEYVTKFN